MKDSLEAECDVWVYTCLRGQGGATISKIRSILHRVIGYFRGQGGDAASTVILNPGVVDAALQPFIFCLLNIAKIPKRDGFYEIDVQIKVDFADDSKLKLVSDRNILGYNHQSSW